MITSIFPTKILVKDFEMSDSWTQAVTDIAKTVFAKNLAEKQDYAGTGNDMLDLFTEENLSQFPELVELKQMFIDSFFELASSYNKNKLTKEVITERVSKDTGKLPFMKKGDYKSVHNHDADVFAFGIFYLNDVNNEKEGGELVLHDPGFSGAWHFNDGHTHKVPTKKNRMVISPNQIWHEVTPYFGETERLAIVVNI